MQERLRGGIALHFLGGSGRGSKVLGEGELGEGLAVWGGGRGGRVGNSH